MEVYLHSLIRLHGVALKHLDTGTTLPLPLVKSGVCPSPSSSMPAVALAQWNHTRPSVVQSWHANWQSPNLPFCFSSTEKCWNLLAGQSMRNGTLGGRRTSGGIMGKGNK
jgi:hypothetical protein